MRHLLSIAAVYGVIMSGITASWTLIEYDFCSRAFNAGDSTAELRHRINFNSLSLAFLLSNILTVAAISGRLSARNRND